MLALFNPPLRLLLLCAFAFSAAFQDDKSISTLEFDGVELAAIQGLNQKIESRDARIGALEKEILELKDAVRKASNAKD